MSAVGPERSRTEAFITHRVPPPGQRIPEILPPKAKPQPYDPRNINLPRYYYGWIVPSIDLQERAFCAAPSSDWQDMEGYFLPKWYESAAHTRAREAYGLVAGLVHHRS